MKIIGQTLSCVATALLLLTVLSGCPPVSRKPPLSGSGMDMFAPVAMRIHPLSRVAIEDQAARLQARLELTDQMGDVTKGIGRVVLALFEYQLLLPGHRGPHVGTWTVDLTTPEANRARWDAITRTYLIEVPLPAGSVKPKMRYVLAATLTEPNGTTLPDTLELTSK